MPPAAVQITMPLVTVAGCTPEPLVVLVLRDALSGVAADAPSKSPSEIGFDVGTPEFAGVFGTHAPPRTNAPSAVFDGAPNSVQTCPSEIGCEVGSVMVGIPGSLCLERQRCADGVLVKRDGKWSDHY